MPRSRDRKPMEIPTYLWDALDRVAKHRNVPTNQLIADWLWQHFAVKLNELATKDPTYAPRELLEGIARPYDRDMGGWRSYPRRERSTSDE